MAHDGLSLQNEGGSVSCRRRTWMPQNLSGPFSVRWNAWNSSTCTASEFYIRKSLGGKSVFLSVEM